MPFKFNPLTGTFDISGVGSGTGNVVGPGTSTAGQIPKFTNTDGVTISGSSITEDPSKNYTFNSLAAASVPTIFETNTHTRYITFTGDKTDNLYSMPQLVLVNNASTAQDTTAGGISGAALNFNGGALRSVGSVNFACDGGGGYVTIITSNSAGTAVNNCYFGPTGFFYGNPAMTIGGQTKPWAAVYAQDLILGPTTSGLYSAIEQNASATLVYLHSLQYLWRWQFYDKTLVALQSLNLQLDNRVWTLAPVDEGGANSTVTGGVTISSANKTAGTGNSGAVILATGTSAGGTVGSISIKPGGSNTGLIALASKDLVANNTAISTNTLRSAQTKQLVLFGSGTDDYYNFGQLTTVNPSTTSDYSSFGTCGEWVGVMPDTTNYSQVRVASIQFLANGAPGLIQFNTRQANGSSFFTILNLQTTSMAPATDNAMDLGRTTFAYKTAYTNSIFTNTIDTQSGGILNLNSAGAAAFTIDGSQILNNKVSANESTGAGSALLGANSPAVTNTSPYKWLKVKSSDASVCYIPMWK